MSHSSALRKVLDSWPEGVVYSFTKEQMVPMLFGARLEVVDLLDSHRPIPTPMPDDPNGIYLTCLCGYAPEDPYEGDTWRDHFMRKVLDA